MGERILTLVVGILALVLSAHEFVPDHVARVAAAGASTTVTALNGAGIVRPSIFERTCAIGLLVAGVCLVFRFFNWNDEGED